MASVTCGVACILVIIVIASWSSSQGCTLGAFPTVRSIRWHGSRWDEVIQRGYQQYKSAPFKIADGYRWMVVFSNRQHVEQVLSAPEDVLSSIDAADERLHSTYTFGNRIHEVYHHAAAISSQVTRRMRTLYPEMRAEIVAAFNELLDLENEEWKSVPALRTVQQIICRASNRVFVGLPLCRDPDYIDLNVRFTIEAFKAGIVIGWFPKAMRPLAAKLFTRVVARDRMRGLKHLGPIIEERLKYLNSEGQEDKQNDFLSWLINEVQGLELAVMVMCVLIINFTAIHTPANNFTQALYYLAANPHYIQPLREEVETIVEREGWTTAALEKMGKVDSFLRESQRLDGISPLVVQRKAMKDFTFSDGTFIPKGTMIGIATRSLHLDNNLYQNAREFQPFRFVDTCGEDGPSIKHRFASTSTEYLPFGHGRHACPGRFFAACELKTMMAHIVMSYDVKLEDEGVYPPNWHVGLAIVANPRAKVLFRKRVK